MLPKAIIRNMHEYGDCDWLKKLIERTTLKRAELEKLKKTAQHIFGQKSDLNLHGKSAFCMDVFQ